MFKFIKKVLCKHNNKNRVWEFFPSNVFANNEKTHGLKITVCLDCHKIIDISDYAK